MDVSAHIEALNTGTGNLYEMPADELEALVAEYPYFQLGHIALLKAYKRSRPDQFSAYLPLAATYAPDRARLQELMMDHDQAVQPEAIQEATAVEHAEESPSTVDGAPSTVGHEQVWPPDKSLEPAAREIHDDPDAPEVEAQPEPEASTPMELEDVPAETAPEDKPRMDDEVEVAPKVVEEEPAPARLPDGQEAIDLPAPSEKHSFTEWLHRLKPPGLAPAPHFEDEPTQVETASDEDQEDPLAQQFQAAAYEAGIVREASRQPDPMAPVAVEEDAEEDEPDYKAVEQQARKSVEMNDALLSETLATVFVIQRNYKKAIEVYEKLRLKFPEKSHYFAARIAELQSK